MTSMQNRRELLSGALVSALARKAGAASPTGKGEWRNSQSGMAYRRFGRTGFMISEMIGAS